MKINKSWYKKPDDPSFPVKNTAGGIVVRREKDKIFIALIGNCLYKDYWLPKGTQEIGEEIAKTARREIAEETGLTELKLVCKLGVEERFSLEKVDWRIGHYFLFETKKSSGKQNLQKGEEDFKLRWFDINKLPPMFWPEQKELIEENKGRIKSLLSR